MNRAVGIVIGLVFVGLGSLFSSNSDKVLNYNDKMVDAIATMDAAFDPFMETVLPYHDDQEVNISTMRSTLASFSNAVQQCETTAKSLEVPDSQACQNQACLAYIDNGNKISQASIEMVDFIADNIQT